MEAPCFILKSSVISSISSALRLTFFSCRCSLSSASLTLIFFFRTAHSFSILCFSSSFSAFFSTAILISSCMFVCSGALNANVAAICSESKPYVVSRSHPSCSRFLSSLVFGLMSMIPCVYISSPRVHRKLVVPMGIPDF